MISIGAELHAVPEGAPMRIMRQLEYQGPHLFAIQYLFVRLAQLRELSPAAQQSLQKWLQTSSPDSRADIYQIYHDLNVPPHIIRKLGAEMFSLGIAILKTMQHEADKQ